MVKQIMLEIKAQRFFISLLYHIMSMNDIYPFLSSSISQSYSPASDCARELITRFVPRISILKLKLVLCSLIKVGFMFLN